MVVVVVVEGGGCCYLWVLFRCKFLFVCLRSLVRLMCVRPFFMLTYGVAGRGERRDGSVWRWVELLLDFGADNPGKVNNSHGSINTLPRAWRFHSSPAALGHLNTVHRVHLCPCMYKCSTVWAACSHIFGPSVTNSQSRGFRGNLAATV